MIKQDWSTLKKLMFAKTAAEGAALVEATASGNPLTFLTDLAKPLKSLAIPFSDENGITSLSVWNGGKNLLNVASENVDRFSGTYTYSEGAIHTNVVGTGNSNYVVFKQKYPAGTYVFSCSVSGGVSNANLLLDIPVSGWEYVSYYGGYVKATNAGTLKFTASEDFNIGVIMRTGTAGAAGAIENIQLEVGEAVSMYEKYATITQHDASFPVEAGSPTAGQLDIISGVLTVTAPTAGTYQLTGEQITALVGNNTIWSDADGSMTAIYLKKG